MLADHSVDSAESPLLTEYVDRIYAYEMDADWRESKYMRENEWEFFFQNTEKRDHGQKTDNDVHTDDLHEQRYDAHLETKRAEKCKKKFQMSCRSGG